MTPLFPHHPKLPYAALMYGIYFVCLIGATLVATVLASGAPFLSVWVILLAMAVMAVALVWVAPPPSESAVRYFAWMFLSFVFFLVVWPRYAFFRLPGMPGLSVSRILQIVVTLGWVYLILNSSTLRQRLIERIVRFRLVFVAIAVIFIFKIGSIAMSGIPFVSIKGVLNELLTTYLPLLIALTLIRDNRDLKRLCVAVSFAGIAVILLGAYESHLGRNLFIGFLDVDSDYLFQVLRDKIRSGSYRIQSTFSHPLVYAEFLAVTLPLVCYALYGKRYRVLRVALFGAYSIGALYVIMKSGSRSGIGGFLISQVSIVSAFLFRGIAQRSDVFKSAFSLLGLMLFMVVAVIATYAVSDILIGRTESEFQSGMVRLAMWKHGLELAVNSPIFGYGQDMAALVLGFAGHGGVLTIDSYYLSVLIETGFFTLFVYVAFVSFPIVLAVRAIFRDGEAALLSTLLGGSFMAFLAIKAVLSLPHNHGLVMILYAALLISFTLTEPRRSPHATASYETRCQ